MRRNWLPFVLSLLFVCAQQAGLVHSIGHSLSGHAPVRESALGFAPTAVAAAASVTSSADASAPASSDRGDTNETGTYCDKCFQFAHVAGAAFSYVPAVLAIETVRESVPARPATVIAVAIPAFRSRGPPTLL